MSSACEVKEVSWKGFPAYSIGNDLVKAVLVPTLGARIVSLTHKTDSGHEREWLWSNPYLEPQLPDFAAPYWGEFDLGGWNECFPSVAGTHYPTGPWKGSQIPEYGELWCQPWKAKVSQSQDEAEIKTVSYGVRFPYRFERSIYVRKDLSQFRLSYTVNNLTIFPFPFLWSAQPFFDVRPGMSISLPPQEVRVYYSEDKKYGHLGSTQMWPHMKSANGEIVDVSVFPNQETAMAVKLYAKAPRTISIKDPVANSELQMEMDEEEISHLAVWLNFGGWSGLETKSKYYNIFVAPCIGAMDDLQLAVNHFKEYAQIQPKNLKSWNVTISFR